MNIWNMNEITTHVSWTVMHMPVIQVDLFFICSPEVKPHTGDGNGKGKGVGRDAADGEREKSQGVRH